MGTIDEEVVEKMELPDVPAPVIMTYI
jgi:ketopantoate reductase